MRNLEIFAAKALYYTLMFAGVAIFIYGIFHEPETNVMAKNQMAAGVLLTLFTLICALDRTRPSLSVQYVFMAAASIATFIFCNAMFGFIASSVVCVVVASFKFFTKRMEQKLNFTVI